MSQQCSITLNRILCRDWLPSVRFAYSWQSFFIIMILCQYHTLIKWLYMIVGSRFCDIWLQSLKIVCSDNNDLKWLKWYETITSLNITCQNVGSERHKHLSSYFNCLMHPTFPNVFSTNATSVFWKQTGSMKSNKPFLHSTQAMQMIRYFQRSYCMPRYWSVILHLVVEHPDNNYNNPGSNPWLQSFSAVRNSGRLISVSTILGNT